MSCRICEIIKNSEQLPILFEDQDAIAFLADEPAVVGHIIVAPKKHAPIIEAVEDRILNKLFNLANNISIAVFEGIGAKGTNLLVSNGISAGQEFPHFCIQIISRKDDDGLLFDWLPKQISEEEMSMIELQLKDGLKTNIEIKKTVTNTKENTSQKISEQKQEITAENKTQEDIMISDKQISESEHQKASEENYLTKQLKRMP